MATMNWVKITNKLVRRPTLLSKFQSEWRVGHNLFPLKDAGKESDGQLKSYQVHSFRRPGNYGPINHRSNNISDIQLGDKAFTRPIQRLQNEDDDILVHTYRTSEMYPNLVLRTCCALTAITSIYIYVYIFSRKYIYSILIIPIWRSTPRSVMNIGVILMNGRWCPRHWKVLPYRFIVKISYFLRMAGVAVVTLTHIFLLVI